ncbi:hypothetical protein L1887_60006 [Cichorium endivia]|nr:hypothetical protein L1887_60006 [Cichorium endivia]
MAIAPGCPPLSDGFVCSGGSELRGGKGPAYRQTGHCPTCLASAAASPQLGKTSWHDVGCAFVSGSAECKSGGSCTKMRGSGLVGGLPREIARVRSAISLRPPSHWLLATLCLEIGSRHAAVPTLSLPPGSWPASPLARH